MRPRGLLKCCVVEFGLAVHETEGLKYDRGGEHLAVLHEIARRPAEPEPPAVGGKGGGQAQHVRRRTVAT